MRRETGHQRVDLKQLVIVGAEEIARRTREADEDRKRQLAELADMIRRREIDLDVEAADEVKRTGWVHQV